MKNTLKARVYSELEAYPGLWFTIKKLTRTIPGAEDRYSTVARALRKLRAEGRVCSRELKMSRYYSEWRIAGQIAASPTSQPQPTGSAPMQNNKPTFTKAVEDVVEKFIAEKRAFSAYDVTTKLREQSNAGLYAINPVETGAVYVDGKSVAKIGHEDVKIVVHDLFLGDKMSGYKRTYTGSYWQYEADVDDAADNGNGGNTGITFMKVPTDYDGSPSL